jgi:hypothetical protein
MINLDQEIGFFTNSLPKENYYPFNRIRYCCGLLAIGLRFKLPTPDMMQPEGFQP